MKKRTQDGEGGLASLVKGELAAVETYKQALAKLGDAPAGRDLRRLGGEHEEAAVFFQEKLEALELDAPEETIPWNASLEGLKEGEERGLREYEQALRDESLDAETRGLIQSTILPRTKARLPLLEKLLKQETGEKQ